MQSIANGAAAPQILSEEASAYVPTKSPFDIRFNGHLTIIKDAEGYLYRIKEDFDYWFGKENTAKKDTEALRNASKKFQLQEFWDKDDWDGFEKAWDEIKASVVKKVDSSVLRQSIADRKATLDKAAAFRTTEQDQVDVYNLHVQTGWKAEKIATEIGLGLPTVLSILKKKKKQEN